MLRTKLLYTLVDGTIRNMSQRISNAQGVSKATDPVAGDVVIIGIETSPSPFLDERTIPDGPSGESKMLPTVTVTPTFTVT